MGVIGFSIRAWWEEEQAEGAAVDERIHLESATKGKYKLLHNTDFRELISFFQAGSRRGSAISVTQSTNFFLVNFLSLISDMG